MKNMIQICLISLLIFSQNLFAGWEKHNFAGEFWSGGKSCLICHSLTNDLPKVAPPNSRIIEFPKLSVTELAAYQNNNKNVICLVCHQAPHSPLLPRNNIAPQPIAPPAIPGGVPGLPGFSTGINMQDCLQCHDLHNKFSNKMLKAGY